MNTALGYITKVFVIASVFGLAFAFITTSVPHTDNQLQDACGTNSSLTGEFDINDTTAFFENHEVAVPTSMLATNTPQQNPVLGSTANLEERWIEVDLSEQKLRAWDGNTLFLETPVSTGLPHTPTPTGEFRVWIKLRATKMEGGEGKYYYYLPNVPYVMFFQNDQVPGYKGYSLHGTYWHNDFGTPHSHGCVNLPTSVAQQLYNWTAPVLADGKNVARSSSDNPGTRIIIHQ